MGFDERGELMGHISIGLELVNSLWRQIADGRERRGLGKIWCRRRKTAGYICCT